MHITDVIMICFDDLEFIYVADCFRIGKYSFEKIPFEEIRGALPYDQ